jgi:hypothetical protein
MIFSLNNTLLQTSPTLDGQFLRTDYFARMVKFTSPKLTTFDFVSYNLSTITFCLDTSDRTKLSN